MFGPHGLRIHACASGEDAEPVRAESHPKSLGRESRLPGETRDVPAMLELLAGLAQQLEEELRRGALTARRVVLRVRFPDRGSMSRSTTLPKPTRSAAEIREASARLLERSHAGARPVRGLGIQLSLLASAGEADAQLDLFGADSS